MIDKTGKFRKGTNFSDLKDYLSSYWINSNGPLSKIIQAECSCGNRYFILLFEQNEGIAKRTCVSCGKENFICDSGKYWEDAVKNSKPKKLKCKECKKEEFELAVGFEYRKGSLFSKGDIRWIVVGARCRNCGILGSPVDWKVDYGPTKHLEKQA